ncbi:MAG: hypothetical protein EA424_24880, partial [Planctomycetaceae bacterium]
MKCPKCGCELEGTKPHQDSCPQCDATASKPIDGTVDIPITPPTADSSTSDAPIDGTVDIPIAPPAESRKAGTATGQISQTVEVDS